MGGGLMTHIASTFSVRSNATMLGTTSVAKLNFDAKPGGVEILTHDDRTGEDLPGRKSGQAPVIDKVVNQAYDTFSAVQDYFAKKFGRSGWDGNGAAARVVVHAPDVTGNPKMNNAYWDTSDRSFHMGDGDGTLFSPLGAAKDVAAHEYTHAVVDSSVKLTYLGQEGGINESFSDVLGSGIDGNWLIGEDVFTPGHKGDAIRDLEHPTYDNFKTLPKDVNEVHDLSGIPSLAAVNVAKAVGRDKMEQIWYHGLVDHLKPHSGFAGAARATMEAAAALYGKDGTEFAAVRDAWKGVGVDARWSPKREIVLAKAQRQFLTKVI